MCLSTRMTLGRPSGIKVGYIWAIKSVVRGVELVYTAMWWGKVSIADGRRHHSSHRQHGLPLSTNMSSEYNVRSTWTG